LLDSITNLHFIVTPKDIDFIRPDVDVYYGSIDREPAAVPAHQPTRLGQVLERTSPTKDGNEENVDDGNESLDEESSDDGKPHGVIISEVEQE
jgi:hypothetical protein